MSIAQTQAAQIALQTLSYTSADPVIMNTYVEEFTRIYGHNRVKIKPAYRHGEFAGYNVRIDDGAWNLMLPAEVAGAIAGFKA